MTSRDEFAFPTFASMGLSSSSDPVVYLCGNSLGLMPKQTSQYVSKELAAWQARAVESHFRNEITTNWVDVDLPLLPSMAAIVGALPSEVGLMGSLTMNLNSLLVAFYQPKAGRTKILFERGAFPSDYYSLYNLAKLKGLDPEETLVQLSPRAGEYTLRTEDILKTIEEQGDEIALVCFAGIQYYSGQLFNIKEITKAAHDKGCVVGWDLAHAVGNVPVDLHDSGADFAVWCNYKYMNSGPGAIGGYFVHDKHSGNTDMPRLAGWWGNNAETRFEMKEQFDPIPSALGFRQSNPSVLDLAAVKSSLDIFAKAGGIQALRNRSLQLTAHLETLLKSSPYYREPSCQDEVPHFTIITPSDPNQRGAQLSLLFKPQSLMMQIFTFMNQKGVICDDRKPNVIRLAPAPLYNTEDDSLVAVKVLNEAFENITKDL